MDYISRKLNKKIKLYRDRNDYLNLKIYLQVKFEYELLLIMAYLWNKNFNELSDEKKTKVFLEIKEPSIGTVVSINRALDIYKELINSKKVNTTINKYPLFRNEKIGHGYSFEDDKKSFANTLADMIDDLEDNVSILKESYVYVNVENCVDGVWQGIAYSETGDYNSWCEPEKKCCLEKGLYLLDSFGNYYRVSPFIALLDENEIFTFRSIDEILLGRIKYNKLFQTDSTKTIEWDCFRALHISQDEYKKVCPNGTIINKFENNYSEYRYIENRSIQNKIDDFIDNKSSVYATLWGHGGVGKTASVQNYCEKLGTDTKRKFDYILFVSAKDRFFDTYTGRIRNISDNTTYVTIIKNLNKLIRGDEVYDEEAIINSDARFLLIVDDFETFSKEDKIEIESFLRKLDINKHKVLITTRANTIFGEEIKSNELNVEETKKFLVEIYKNLFNLDICYSLNDEKMGKIHSITSGRPIFILQFAYICAKMGIDNAIKIDLKNNREAIEFLYGRIYDYLNPNAQKIFSVLGVLADVDDLTNLLDKVKYILNMENDSSFRDNVAEIEKLRLIEIIDNKFYKVYSSEILDMMKAYFDRNDDNFKNVVKVRMSQVSKDKNLDNDHALLANANSARYSKGEQEVVSLYQQIINRKNTKREIKIDALLNMAEYLYTDRGNKEQAIQKLLSYNEFSDISSYVKMLSGYLRGNNENEKSIEVLLSFFAYKRDFKNDEVLELFGSLVSYRALYWLDLREETKNGFKYGEIYEEDYYKQCREQSQEFRDIKNKQGERLVQLIQDLDFQKISSGARQSLITATYHYIEVCIRLRDWSNGRYLCNYVKKKLWKYNYGLNFELKETRINQYSRK